MKPSIFLELFSKKMTRKEFLFHMGLVVLGITGLTGIIKIISDPQLINKPRKVSSGFGSGPYGT